MKKFYFLFAALLLCGPMAKAIEPYVQPEFNENEWTYVGEGFYTGGVFDWLGTEYLEEIPAFVWVNKADNSVFWIDPDEDFEKEPFWLPEGDDWLQTPAPFILYTANPKKVYTSPIWTMHPVIFCAYQRVKEIQGMTVTSDAYYGTLDENGHITFPELSYDLLTIPTGAPRTNAEGTFAITLPDLSGVETLDEDTTPAEYYNLQGVKVANPERGHIYIAKRATKSVKVVF